MTMKKTIIAALLAGASIAAHATVPLNKWDGQWFHIDSGTSEVYITAPTKNADGTASFWMKTDIPSGKMGVYQVKGHYDINCSASTMRSGAQVQYDGTGDVVRSFDTVDPWHPIFPDSEGSIIQGLVCATKK
jgi:hypothetical protein